MNIHLLSNSPTRVTSGFGVVCRNLALELQKRGHDVSISDMQNLYNMELWNNIKIYPMNSIQDAATGNPFYISELEQLKYNLVDSKSEALIIIYPAYDNVIVSNNLHKIHKNTIWYYPVEGENLPQTYLKELSKVKKIVPITKQGKKELDKANSRLKDNLGTNSNFNDNNTLNIHKSEIYHGFDDNVFKRLKNSKSNTELKESHYCKWSTDKYQLIQDKKWLCKHNCFSCNGFNNVCNSYEEEKIVVNIFGQEFINDISSLSSLKDKFGFETIFGFTGENNGNRKKIDRLLDSFSMLCKSKDTKSSEILLLLHTMPYNINGLNLWEYIKKYDMGKCRVLFVYGQDRLGNSWSNEALNILYNSIDVNVSCSSCEGFGLPTIESMATGKPNIAPNFSSFPELIIGNSKNEIEDNKDKIRNDTNNNVNKIEDNKNEINNNKNEINNNKNEINNNKNEINNNKNNRGLLADIQGYELLPNGIRRALVASKSISELMGIISSDKNLMLNMGNNAYIWSQQYTWKILAKQWESLLLETI